VPQSYSLLKDGDGLERTCVGLFLNKEFSAYEKFWLDFIVPLTNRPIDIHFKTDAELQAIGRTHNDICVAQLHYTVLRHLFRTCELRTIKPMSLDQFIEAITRLLAALDVADELLERRHNEDDPWSESEGREARVGWRQSHGDSLKHLRRYRNRLIHGRVSPTIIIKGTYSRLRVPRFGKENDYLDWRRVTNGSVGSGGTLRSDFDSPNNLTDLAWEETLNYLESSWTRYLLKTKNN